MSLMRQGTGCERFEELSALAIVGRVSSEEFLELKTHLESCKACREEHESFSAILLDQLPLAHFEMTTSDSLQVASANTENMEAVGEFAGSSPSVAAKGLKSDSEPVSLTNVMRWLAGNAPSRYAHFAVLVLLFVAGALVFKVYTYSKQLRFQDAELRRLNREVPSPANISSVLPARGAPRETEVGQDGLKAARIREVETRFARLLARDEKLKRELEEASSAIASLRAEVESSRGEESALSARLNEAEQSLAKVGDELEKGRNLRIQDADTIRRQQERLQQAEQELAGVTSSVERDRQLLAADRDIRDLMGARNLRIIDVFDVDGKGRTRKPFGRVFFTEGKSLIFYAFDLGTGRPSVQSASYQAWGYEGSYNHAVRSLGIFYQDDRNANRWVLKFDDPSVLEEIDSVFVTVEPPGGSNKPTGTKLLAAYLKANINHP